VYNLPSILKTTKLALTTSIHFPPPKRDKVNNIPVGMQSTTPKIDNGKNKSLITLLKIIPAIMQLEKKTNAGTTVTKKDMPIAFNLFVIKHLYFFIFKISFIFI
jgi:hypothetical protein